MTMGRVKPGHFVNFFVDSHAFDQVAPVHGTADFGQDGGGVRIPLGDLLSFFDALAVAEIDECAVGNRVAVNLAPAIIYDEHRAVAVHRHDLAFAVEHRC
jgi:hypothetical protein